MFTFRTMYHDIMTWCRSQSINKMEKKNYARCSSRSLFICSLDWKIQHRKKSRFFEMIHFVVYVSPNCFLSLCSWSRSLFYSRYYHVHTARAKQAKVGVKFFGWIPYRYVWLHVSYTPTTEVSAATAAVTAAATVIRHLEPFRFASITFDMEESHLISNKTNDCLEFIVNK